MHNSRIRRNTVLFSSVLLLSGVLHSLQVPASRLNPFLDTLIFCTVYLIDAGLILFWALSVYQRLIPTRARTHMIAAAGMMLLLLFLRSVRYRVAGEAGFFSRLCWYGYYLPFLLIPTLFLMSCLSMGHRTARRADERLLLIPACILFLCILTNDLHLLAFAPADPGLSLTGESGTYQHGPLYYLVYFWDTVSIIAGILYLMAASRRLHDWKKAAPPFLFLLLTPLMTYLEIRVSAVGLVFFFTAPDIIIFCLIGTFEACIRCHLIPGNENYADLFRWLRIPAWITDEAFRTVYATSVSVSATPEQMARSLTEPVYLGGSLRLSGSPIRGGYAFRAEDEQMIRHLNERLEAANDTLALENEVLERENALILERASTEERSRLYAAAAREVYPAQKQISDLLQTAVPDTPEFRPVIARVLPLMAYVKRKSNFVLLAAERDTITGEELASAMRESAHYLRYSGIHLIVDAASAPEGLPCRTAMAVYNGFEDALEALYGKSTELWVRLSEGELLVLADCAELPSLPVTALPGSATLEDGQLILRFSTAGGAA